MQIAVLAEGKSGERRVSASPDTIKAYVKKGLSVGVQAGAGAGVAAVGVQLVARPASLVGMFVEADSDIGAIGVHRLQLNPAAEFELQMHVRSPVINPIGWPEN